MCKLLADFTYITARELEEIINEFLEPPFYYSGDVIDEVIDIITRIDTLTDKLNTVEYAGNFRYE